MSLDPATVRRIARLARIRVDDAAVPAIQSDLSGILDWMAQLNAVDVDGIDPLTGGSQIALRMRADAITDGGIADAVLANAPDRAGVFFAVPKVIE